MLHHAYAAKSSWFSRINCIRGARIKRLISHRASKLAWRGSKRHQRQSEAIKVVRKIFEENSSYKEADFRSKLDKEDAGIQDSEARNFSRRHLESRNWLRNGGSKSRSKQDEFSERKDLHFWRPTSERHSSFLRRWRCVHFISIPGREDQECRHGFAEEGPAYYLARLVHGTMFINSLCFEKALLSEILTWVAQSLSFISNASIACLLEPFAK